MISIRENERWLVRRQAGSVPYQRMDNTKKKRKNMKKIKWKKRIKNNDTGKAKTCVKL